MIIFSAQPVGKWMTIPHPLCCKMNKITKHDIYNKHIIAVPHISLNHKQNNASLNVK